MLAISPATDMDLRHRIGLSRQSRALQVASVLSRSIIVVCVVILVVGYGAGYERVFQPWPGGPSTHPITALALAFLALGIYFHHPIGKSWRSTAAFAVAFFIGLMRISDVLWDWHVLDHITPFSGELARLSLNGSAITFGWNTAVAVVMAGLAGILQRFERPVVSQIFSLVALSPPLVSGVGYSYGLRGFYGAMSIYTTLILLGVCIGILLSTAHRGFMSMALNNYTAGKIARRVILAILLVPYASGMLIVHLNSESENDRSVALLVVIVALGNAAVAVYTLFEVERLDRMRRGRERADRLGATHDPLTGLANRRLFEAIAGREFARSKRLGSKLCVVMIDVDHFKGLNDKFGHQVGDRVLARVGQVLSGFSRGADTVGRYGGEEFIALLPDTGVDGALDWSEKLRTAIASANISDKAGRIFVVTVSNGVAESIPTDDNFAPVVDRADQAMYAAKAAGRNRTCKAL